MASRHVFRADTTEGYVEAVLELIRLARESDLDFTFGPMKIEELRQTGLTVSGPDASKAKAALSAIRGLAETRA